VDSDVKTLCRAHCSERVVVVEGIGEATVQRLEDLLLRVLPEAQSLKRQHYSDFI
jgi:hypothetical protein